MLYLIVGVIVICIAIWLIKKIGGFTLKIGKGLFGFIFGIIKIVTTGPIVLCTEIFYGLAKLFHIQSFIFYILSLGSLPSFIYLCSIHIPYSRKERFINLKDFFIEKKKIRNKTIVIAFFTTLEALIFLALPSCIRMEEDVSYLFYFFGIIYLLASFIYTFSRISKWKKENKSLYEYYENWRKWSLKEATEITEGEIEENLISASIKFAENDKNKNKFTIDNIPYGRVIAFISYFGKNLDDEEPIYFSPKISSDENELREYGILITSKGVYISSHGKDDVEIPYAGLWRIANDENKTYFDYGLSYGEPKIIEIEKNLCTVNFDCFIQQQELFENISLAFLQDKVRNDLDEAFESYEDSSVRSADEAFSTQQKITDISKAAEIGGLGAGLSQNAHIYNDEVKNYMNGARGGGYAAEYGNNAIDRLTGKKVENLAQDLENGHQKLHGADRNVNGVNIQTKYYKSASESIGAVFEHKQALYLNDDGTMMQIEVPRDQYNQAVQEMQKRIKTGQVPGETNPDNAKNYVRKGHFTYAQANNIALAGSIEGIAVDISQGIVCSLPGAGITFALSFASAVWHGQDIKEAAKQSTLSGLKVMGKSAAIYTITMQLSRDKIVNIFAPKIMVGEPGKQVVKSFGYVKNPIFTGAEKVAGKISSRSLAKSKVGKAIKLDKVNGRQVIGGTVTAVVVYGPDVCKAFQGKISGKQLIKNSTVNTAGLIGAGLGTLIPIPVVGSMIGGAVGSFVAKKIMDNFIEDDAVVMFKIMREEFLDIVMLYSFNKEEFDEIVSATIGNSEMSKVLQAMYQSGTPKEYADALINAEVQVVLSKREKITPDKIEEGIKLLLEDKTVA